MKKVLLSLLVVGAVGCFTITGTYAVLNTETHNARGSIASGTLTFSDKVNAATACLSINGPASPGNVNSGCDALFTNSTLMYPGTLATVHVTIANTGSIDGSTKHSRVLAAYVAYPAPGVNETLRRGTCHFGDGSESQASA